MMAKSAYHPHSGQRFYACTSGCNLPIGTWSTEIYESGEVGGIASRFTIEGRDILLIRRKGTQMRTISYDPLWKKLVDAKLNRTELAEKAGFSRGTITKMGKNEPVGLDVILKICNFLDCGIEDVVEIRKS